ncbi:unnamed protein product [Absidia cylindrospora]
MKSNSAKTNLVEERRKDHISHFVLRLAYCRSEESRDWFLRQEDALFKFRFEQEMAEDRRLFLETANLDWKVVDPATKKELQQELERCARTISLKNKSISIASYVAGETYFEVDFEKVPDLVRRRAVYVHKGKAFVPMANQLSLVLDEFGSQLSKMLQATAKALPRLEEDDRLKPILVNVEKQYAGKTYTGGESVDGDLKAADVDKMVEQHGPLCMRTINDGLRREKHLKHGGRVQYGLFLKAIGLSVEEALLFWRIAFATKTDEQFQKQYAYNIRHNYGLEGKRVSYTAFSCGKIIKGNSPAAGDHHGCPFRHFSNGNLEATLYKDKLTGNQVRVLLDLVRDSHFQVACTKHFEFTHPQHEQIDIIEHPNAYYELSLEPEKNDAMDVER